MTIQEKEQEIISAFNEYTDWMERYEYIIELGKHAPALSDEEMIDANLVKGCQSRVWVTAQHRDGMVYYTAYSDALIVRGLAQLLVMLLSGETPDTIRSYEPMVFHEIGLTKHLSPARTNGFLSLLQTMKQLA